MGSPCELVCEATRRSEALSIASLVADEAWRIEDKFSRYLEGNVIDRINSAAGRSIEVDPETADLLDFAVALYQLSDRRFDITSGILRRAWCFDGGARLPSMESVRALLPLVGWHQAEWRRPVLTLPDGMEIDLGGIGKEYAADRCANLVRQGGASPCLVNFGGDLVATDAPARRRHWRVAVESEVSGTPERVVNLRRGAVATSGDARRFLLCNGRRYGHILDPSTGWPVPDAPGSVTVLADSCVEAGMLSTLAMLRGGAAEEFLAAQEVVFWCRR